MEERNFKKRKSINLVIRLTNFPKLTTLTKRKSKNLITKLTKFNKKPSRPTRMKRDEQIMEVHSLLEEGQKMFSRSDFESAADNFAEAGDITDNWKKVPRKLRTDIHLKYADAMVACGEIFTPLQIYNIATIYVGRIRYKRIKHFTKYLMLICEQDNPSDYKDPFLCTFCENIPYEPVTVCCGHTFCRLCINRIKRCEICRCLHRVPSKPDIMVSRLIEKTAPGLDKVRPLRRKILQQLLRFQIQEALQTCNEALLISNRDHFILNQRSEILYDLEDYEKSLEDAEMVTQLYPRYCKGYQRQALALEKLGRIEEAIFAYCLFRYYYRGTIVPSLKHKIMILLQILLSEYNTNMFTNLSKIREKLDKMFEEKNRPTEILDPTNISFNDFQCPVCYDIVHTPVSLPCGHTLCSNCLSNTIKRPNCPYCQAELTQKFVYDFKSNSFKRNTRFIDEGLKRWFPPRFKLARFHPRETISILNITSEVCRSQTPFEDVQRELDIYNIDRFRIGILSIAESAVEFYRYGCTYDVVKCGKNNKILPKIYQRFRVPKDSIPNSDLLIFHEEVEYIVDYPIDEPELSDLKVLQDTVRRKSQEWFNSLSTSGVYVAIKLFGEMPELEENWHTLSNGPAWVWWMMAVKTSNDIWQSRMIALQKLEYRLEWISKAIDKYPNQCVSNDISINVAMLFVSWNTKITCDAVLFVYMILAYCLHLSEYGSTRKLEGNFPVDYFQLFEWIFTRLLPWKK